MWRTLSLSPSNPPGPQEVIFHVSDPVGSVIGRLSASGNIWSCVQVVVLTGLGVLGQKLALKEGAGPTGSAIHISSKGVSPALKDLLLTSWITLTRAGASLRVREDEQVDWTE